jgi:hypothetical protein
MNKDGAMIGMLVKLAAVAIVIILLLWIVFKLLVFFGIVGEEIVCEWSVLPVAASQAASAGLIDIDPACKTKYYTITLENLTKMLPKAHGELEALEAEWNANKQEWAEIHDKFNYGALGNDQEAKDRMAYEWALNDIVASHLQQCWRKVWKGKLPIFDSWWNLIDIWDGDKPDSKKAALLKYDGFFFKTYGPPTFCVLCSRLNFDPEIAKVLGKSEIDSLTEWTRARPTGLPGEQESIFEFLLDEKQKGIGELGVSYSYDVSEPYAVEFVRVNEWGATPRSQFTNLESYFSDQFGEQPWGNRLFLLPSADALYPFERDKFVGSGAEELNRPMQCLRQVG